MPHYTYILRCSDGTYYTGYTVDIERREREHNQGIGCKYTRTRRPVELVYFEEYETRSQATGREAAIKKLTREKKEALISQRNQSKNLKKS